MSKLKLKDETNSIDGVVFVLQVVSCVGSWLLYINIVHL